MTKEKMTSAQSVKLLQNLNQQSAAWLIGCTARTLRDWPDAPRNANGSYNGRELITWMDGKTPRPEITDDDYERLLVISETLYEGEPTDGQRLSIVDHLRNLRETYGEAAWLVFVDVLIQQWSAADEQFREDAFHIPTESDIRREVQQETERRMKSFEAELARDKLHIANVCMDCGKVRRGREWEKAESPKGYETQRDCCPACQKHHCADKSRSE